jgi:outer membrane protein TolC
MINYIRNLPIYRLIILQLLVTSLPSGLNAQNRLNDYISHGLESNQSIKEQGFLLKKNIYALQEAKSMFLPSVTFSTTYTKADGGRTIDFPTGDLFMPPMLR